MLMTTWGFPCGNLCDRYGPLPILDPSHSYFLPKWSPMVNKFPSNWSDIKHWIDKCMKIIRIIIIITFWCTFVEGCVI